MIYNPGKLINALHRLAGLYGIQLTYYDVSRKPKRATTEALLAALKAMDASINKLEDVPDAWREKIQDVTVIEPVTVAWNGEYPRIILRLPVALVETVLACRLAMESGEVYDFVVNPGRMAEKGAINVEGKRYSVREYVLRKKLPFGYHRLSINIAGKTHQTLIISAPLKSYSPPKGNDRLWGAFLPLYALKTREDWGSGDYTGLDRLSSFVAGAGGNVIGTLPLLPVFLERPFDPSPYAPVSRLLWNEFYVDAGAAPEMETCESAREMVQSAPFINEMNGLRESPLVDYRALMIQKRRIMEELSRSLTDTRREEMNDFAGKHPDVEKYAGFRAVMEKQQANWYGWPSRIRQGAFHAGDYDEATRRYYLYSQWLAFEQVKNMVERSRARGVTIYFDLPLGVHPDGYDVWREGSLFSLKASVGAPPDAVFTNGQNWGFPPFHPESVRRQQYSYVIAYIRHHLRYAGMLRLDHVMGMHHLYWIPQGVENSGGMYVRYRSDELYAIMTLESQRHRSLIVGEDLGIVPGYVRPAMARHGLHRMYVLRYELADNDFNAINRVHARSVASLNTHDMATFASFWEDDEIREKERLGLLDPEEARKEMERAGSIKRALITFLRKYYFLAEGDIDTREVLRSCLSYLAGSRARLLLVNLEDLWLEKKFQNVPGTSDEYPNWRRKARYSLEEFSKLPEVVDILKQIDEIRSGQAG